VGTGLQGLVVLNVSTYEPEPWHGTLIVIGVGCFAVFFNTFLSKKLPLVEGMILLLHVVGLFAIMIPLLILAPKSNSKTVFTEFTNNGGWPTDGVSFMVGLNPIVISLLGFDSSVHMCKCQSLIHFVLATC
jgi:amino acid transporter